MTTRQMMDEWGADRLKLAAAEARIADLEAVVDEMLTNGGCSPSEWMPMETIRRARKVLAGRRDA